jgi:hypothetical protein
MTEAELQKACIAILNDSGLVHWRIPLGQSGMHGKASGKSSCIGFPDLCGITATGLFWAVELKTTQGRLRPAQVVWLDRLADSGAVVRVIRSVGEFAAFVTNLKV